LLWWAGESAGVREEEERLSAGVCSDPQSSLCRDRLRRMRMEPIPSPSRSFPMLSPELRLSELHALGVASPPQPS